VQKTPKSKKAQQKAEKRYFMRAKKYMIIERESGRVIAYEVSKHINPAHDAFLKGYNLIKNQAVACQ